MVTGNMHPKILFIVAFKRTLGTFESYFFRMYTFNVLSYIALMWELLRTIRERTLETLVADVKWIHMDLKIFNTLRVFSAQMTFERFHNASYVIIWGMIPHCIRTLKHLSAIPTAALHLHVSSTFGNLGINASFSFDCNIFIRCSNFPTIWRDLLLFWVCFVMSQRYKNDRLVVYVARSIHWIFRLALAIGVRALCESVIRCLFSVASPVFSNRHRPNTVSRMRLRWTFFSEIGLIYCTRMKYCRLRNRWTIWSHCLRFVAVQVKENGLTSSKWNWV